MFLHLSVILFTGGGMCGRGCMARGMRGRGHVWQEGMHGMGACAGGMAGGPACEAREMPTAADGTHHTGMHSCLFNFYCLLKFDVSLVEQ